MKNADLIKALQQLPPDVQVLIPDNLAMHVLPIHSVFEAQNGCIVICDTTYHVSEHEWTPKTARYHNSGDFIIVDPPEV